MIVGGNAVAVADCLWTDMFVMLQTYCMTCLNPTHLARCFAWRQLLDMLQSPADQPHDVGMCHPALTKQEVQVRVESPH